MFSNKAILITGGTSTFGNAFLNRFLDTDITENRIFSRDSLFKNTIPSKTIAYLGQDRRVFPKGSQ